MLRLHVFLGLFTTLGLVAGEATVTLDVTRELSIGGVHELSRSRYFNTHNPPRWGGIPAGLHEVLEDDWQSTPARSMWHLTQAPQHPEHKDRIADSFFDKPLAGAAGLKLWQKDHPTTDMILAIGRFPWFMSVTGRDHSGTPRDFKLAADTLLRVVRNFDTHAGRGPAYLEVMNESDIPQNFCWHWDEDAWQKNSAYHNIVAKTIKAEFPDVMVGGPAQCSIRYHLRDFKVWRKQLGYFIPQSGPHLDFLSFHIYDFKTMQAAADYRGGPGGDSYLSCGPRIHAVFDLVEQTCLQALGTAKPIVVSEYGGLGQESHFGWKGTHAEAEWMNLRACNALLMDMLGMPDRLLKSVPFMVPTAPWDDEYPFALWRKQPEGQLGRTSLGRFYQLFRNVRGGRLPVTSTNRNTRVHAFRDGYAVHLLVNHIGGESVDVNITHLLPERLHYTDATFSSVAFVDGKVRYRSDEPLPDHTRLTLQPDETARVSFRLSKMPTPTERIDERRSYADERIVAIGTEPHAFRIAIPKADLGTIHSATLRLGLARSGGFDTNPAITINGKPLGISLGWTAGVPTFWGAIEIPLDPAALQADNALSLTFDKAAGQISTAAISYRVRVAETTDKTGKTP
jgi:agarase